MSEASGVNTHRHALVIYGRVCAQTLARAHARTGDRIAIASYLGQSDVFDRAIVAFSHAYALQSDRDYAALRAAITSGRIRAATEP
jgi:thiamine monophosphate kinase